MTPQATPQAMVLCTKSLPRTCGAGYRPTPQATGQATAQAEALRSRLLQDQDAALGMPTDQVTDQVERAPCQAWHDSFNTLPKSRRLHMPTAELIRQ